MTGFGVGRALLGQGRVVVEVRSVNHRFLDIRVRAPREFLDMAMHVEQLARRRLGRGRFDLLIRSEGPMESLSTVNTARAQVIYEALKELRDRIAPGAEVPFSMLSAVPDLFVSDNTDLHDATLQALSEAFDQALEATNEMRVREGVALRNDLMSRLSTVAELTKQIASHQSGIVQAHRKRLQERIQRLLSGTAIEADPSRIEQEVAFAAERCDIEEELTRLESHFSHFEHLSHAKEPSGRRLDFLLQEMAREVNTIGAKSQCVSVVPLIVEIKAEIERMREQVQNVE